MTDYSAVAPPQSFNQSRAFAAALQRAKQIAAKINPNAAAGGETGDPGRQKRPLDDGGPEPEPKKLAGLDYGGNSQTMSPPGGGGTGGSQTGGLGTAGNGPVMVEDISVPDKMVGLIIGRGGEQITRLQAKSGCKIQMATDSNGRPDRVCTLMGTRDAIERAKDMIFSIVDVHQRGGRQEPPGMGDGMPGGPVGGGAAGSGGMSGPGGPNLSSSSGSGGVTHVEIMVPGPKVGLIIGKGGETIKQLQSKSGAKMVVIQEGPNPEAEKPLRISGELQEVEYAKQLVYDLIAEKEMQASNRGGGRNPGRMGGNQERGGPNMGGYEEYGNQGGGGNGPGGNGGDGVEVLVPRTAVGVVIGKGGDMIKKIQAETGAKVQFQQGRDEGPGDRRCYLTGKPQHVDAARQRIEELIDSVHRRDNDGPPGTNRNNRREFGNGNQRNGNGPQGGGYGGPPGGPGGPWGNTQGQGGAPQQIEVSFQVPTYKCGVIIGRGGETIKQINQQSGAHCELDRRTSNNTSSNEKTFIIRGDPECVENAKRIIGEKVQLLLFFTQSGPGGMQCGPGGPGGAPAGMAAAGPMSTVATAYPGMAAGPHGYGQAGWGAGTPGGDYQQQQQQWAAAGQAQPNVAQPAQIQINPATGQPDYSKQWAEYYRSLGMHREADMIEQQAKANIGATGQQPATAAGAPQQPGAQQAPAAAAQQATQVAQMNPALQAGAVGTVTATPQPDYSAQWAEYYRSIGKIKEAEAIEAQMKNKGGAVASQPTQPGQQPAVAAAPGTTLAAPTAAVVPTAPTAQPQAFPAYGAYGGYYAQQPAANQPGAPQGQYAFPGYSNYQAQQAAANTTVSSDN